MDLSKLEKLLNLAEDQPDTPEGEAAMHIAQKHLEKLGLTAEDVRSVELPLCSAGYTLWEAALLHAITLHIPCDLIERDTDGELEVVIRGPGHTVDHVAHLYSVLCRAVREKSFDYAGVLLVFCDQAQTLALQQIFCAYAVVALSERLMVEETEDDENEEPKDPGDGGEETSEPDPDPLDKLITSLDGDADLNDLPLSLDPAVKGYNAGLGIPLVLFLKTARATAALTQLGQLELHDEPLEATAP